MAADSRASISQALVPNQWRVLFIKQDPVGDPMFFWHQVDFTIHADPNNSADVRIRIQDSNGICANCGATVRLVHQPCPSCGGYVTWNDRWPTVVGVGDTVVPGGRLVVSTHHVHRWVRVLLYSTAAGRVDATVVIDEEQVVPQLLPGEGAWELPCATLCQIDCETGDETAGF